MRAMDNSNNNNNKQENDNRRETPSPFRMSKFNKNCWSGKCMLLWHVIQAPTGLHEHLDLYKEISMSYSRRDTFIEGFPIEPSVQLYLSIKHSLWEKSWYHLPVAAVSYPVVDRIPICVIILVKNLERPHFFSDRLSQCISLLSTEYKVQFPRSLSFI